MTPGEIVALVSSYFAPPPPPPPPPDPKAAYGPLTAQAEKVATRHADMADKLRARADVWGKAVAGLGTTAVGWISLTTVTDVFPITNHDGVVAGRWTAVCLVAMAISALFVGWWFQRQTRPLLMKLSPRRMYADNDVNCMEAQTIAQIYGEFGELNKRRVAPGELVGLAADKERDEKPEKSSNRTYGLIEAADLIQSYAQTAVSLEAAAEDIANTAGNARDIEAMLARAAQIRAEVYATQMRASAVIVRSRAMGITTGLATSFAVLVFSAGLIGLAYSSNWSREIQADSANRLKEINDCTAAVKALAEQSIPIGTDDASVRLPGVCGGVSLPPTEAKASLTDITALADALAKCRTNAPAGPQPACEAISSELSATVSEISKN